MVIHVLLIALIAGTTWGCALEGEGPFEDEAALAPNPSSTENLIGVTPSGIFLSLLVVAGYAFADGEDQGAAANAGFETRAVTGPICPRGATVPGIDVSS